MLFALQRPACVCIACLRRTRHITEEDMEFIYWERRRRARRIFRRALKYRITVHYHQYICRRLNHVVAQEGLETTEVHNSAASTPSLLRLRRRNACYYHV